MYSTQILNRDTQIRHIMYTDIETDRYTDIEKDRDSQSSTVLSCRFFSNFTFKDLYEIERIFRTFL